MKIRQWLKTNIPLLLLVGITAAISAPVYSFRILHATVNDYDAHIVWTLKILKHQLPPTGIFGVPVLELTIGFIYWAGRGLIGLWETAVLVQVLAQVAAAIILYYWIGKVQGKWGEFVRVFFSITLTIVAPIMLLAFLDQRFYFGYIGLANYHNPTVHLLRPVAIINFIFATRVFHPGKNPRWMILLSALFMIGGMLTKPNYAIALLPGVGTVALWYLWKRRPIDWWMMILGIIIPAAITLTYQAVVIYLVDDAEPAGIILTFFGVAQYLSKYLFPKFLLSIVFPLSVLLMYWKKIKDNSEMMLAWFTFFWGIVQLYFLAESGERFYHANFFWGAMVALFLLFAASVRFLLNNPERLRAKWNKFLPYIAYICHVISGIVYYIFVLIQLDYK